MDMMDEKVIPDALCAGAGPGAGAAVGAGAKAEEGLARKGAEPDAAALAKRGRDLDDADKPEAKKPCLEEVATAPLEEALSDISEDDADGILNREDSEMPGQSLSVLPTTSVTSMATALGHTPLRETEPERDERPGGCASVSAPVSAAHDSNRDLAEARSLLGSGMEDRQPDEETMDNLDFEEISDEELDPEENKAGIGDALGVDWASLVAESRPRAKPEAKPGSARRRWESHRVLMRLGMSFRFAGTEIAETIMTKIKGINAEAEEEKKKKKKKKKKGGPEEEDVSSSPDESVESNFLHPVAAIHVNLREKAAKRRALFANAGPYKRALSARRDLAIRRQLCNLPVKETVSDIQPNTDQDLYRLSVQLLERSL